MATALRPSIERAHNAGYPFRLTELNSVTCGGLAGVSDVRDEPVGPDGLFELLRAGLDGVHIHVRVYAINAAFALTDRGLVARPRLYGLILFTRTSEPDPVMVGLRVHTPPSVDLKAWAVRVRGGVLHVLLINKSKHAVTGSVSLPTTGSSSCSARSRRRGRPGSDTGRGAARA